MLTETGYISSFCWTQVNRCFLISSPEEPVCIKSVLFRILDNEQSPEAKNFLIGLCVCVATGNIWYAFDCMTA